MSHSNTLFVCQPTHSIFRVFETLGAGVVLMTLDGHWVDINNKVCEQMGYSREELLGKRFEDLFHAVDPFVVAENRRRLLAGILTSYSTVRTATSRAGKDLCFRCVVSMVRDEDSEENEYLVQVMDEISELVTVKEELRKSLEVREELGRVMIGAQDQDRSQIARELHDDIGQSLAILKAQLSRHDPLLGVQDERAMLNRFASKVQLVADKVRHLSHNLYSPELEFLGLTVALESHCSECAEEFGIPVECRCNPVVDRVDGAVSLALVRVLQESLHNMVKYSSATRVWVSLTVIGDRLLLTVRDNGVGFNAIERYKSGGLGLISMRERMHLAGGTLEIESEVGAGTTLKASAPIAGGKRTLMAPVPIAEPRSAANARWA
jgi:PAS domain S-box-containing protein